MTNNYLNNRFYENLNIMCSDPGDDITLNIIHSDNSDASSHAKLQITSGGALGGDSSIVFSNSIAQRTLGIDNSDSDIFKISLSNVPETNTVKYFDDGDIKRIYQPAFFAYRSSDVANVTGKDALYTIIFDSIEFDINGDFDTATGEFTAPCDGTYYLCAGAKVNGLASCSFFRVDIVMTDFAIASSYSRPVTAYSMCDRIDVIAEMDQGDTAYVQIIGQGEAANTGDLVGESIFTHFCGMLVQ